MLALGAALALFFALKAPQTDTSGVVFSAQSGPIEEAPFIELPRVYGDVLAPGWQNWSWDAQADFDARFSTERGNSIKVQFKKPSAGFMMHAPHFSTAPYHSLKFSLYNAGDEEADFYIELSDKSGYSLGVQPLSWYAERVEGGAVEAPKALEPGRWYDFTIPLSNLNASGRNISGISIAADGPGTIYLDDLEFSKEISEFPKWIEKTPAFEPPVQPILLREEPYVSDFYDRQYEWRAGSGIMKMDFGKMRLETGTSSNYGMFELRGGQFWIDYRYTAHIDWAIGDSINLLARYSPEGFFSCSFFDDGTNATLSQTWNGEAKTLASAPNYVRHRKYNWSQTKNLAIEIKDDQVSCLANGKVKVQSEIAYPASLFGTAVIEIWSPEPGQSSMSVNKVTVQGL